MKKMKRTTLITRVALMPAMCGALLIAAPAPADASWGSFWHKATHAAKHAASTVKHTATHAANTVKHTAEKTGRDIKKDAEKTGRAIEKGARATGAAIEKGAKAAAAEMGKLSGQLFRITGHCQTAIDKFGHSISSAMPPTRVAGLPQLSSNKCEAAQMSGFMCGIFPYANNIVKAIAEGAHDMKALGHHVDQAYNSHACSHFSKVDPNRGVCALFVGLARETEESVECIVDVAKKMASGKRGNAHFNETEVCHAIGNFEFGFVADKIAVAGAAEENQKLIKFAQLLRTALSVKGDAAKEVQNIASCRKARR